MPVTVRMNVVPQTVQVLPRQSLQVQGEFILLPEAAFSEKFEVGFEL